jgi:hypothetical protein
MSSATTTAWRAAWRNACLRQHAVDAAPQAEPLGKWVRCPVWRWAAIDCQAVVPSGISKSRPYLSAMSGFVLVHDVLRDATSVPELGVAVVPGPLTDGLESLAVRCRSTAGTRLGLRRTCRRGTGGSTSGTPPSPFAGPPDHGLDGGPEILSVRGAEVEGVAVAVVSEGDTLLRLDLFTRLCLALVARQQCHRRLGHNTLFLYGH